MSLEYKFENRGTVQVRPTADGKNNYGWYAFAASVIVLITLLTWLFVSGYLTPLNSTGIHAMTLRGKMNELERLGKKQSETIRSLEDQLAAAHREQQVQTTANDELSKKIALMESDLAQQKEKMVLYEDILSPADLEQGLHIQHFGIKKRLVDSNGKKTGDKQLYLYHLVLAHIREGENVAEGSFTITLKGQQDGKTVSLTQKDTTPSGEQPLTQFSVKYYQSLEGNLLLPKDFQPESVQVKVKPSSGDVPERLTQSYDWKTFTETQLPTTAKVEKE